MKAIGIAFASILFASSAIAADVYDNIDPEIPTVASNPHTMGGDTFTWAGGYIGVNGGYAAGKFTNTITATDLGTGTSTVGEDTINRAGFLGGVQAGYNWQAERTVYGFEVDVQGGSLKKDKAVLRDSFETITQRNSVDWFSTARARVGFTVSPTAILYATGGAAYGKVKSGLESSDEDTKLSWSKDKLGYAVGGGTEIGLTDNLTFKTEYLYTDLGKSKMFDVTDQDLGASLRGETKFNFHTVRAGFNVKF